MAISLLKIARGLDVRLGLGVNDGPSKSRRNQLPAEPAHLPRAGFGFSGCRPLLPGAPIKPFEVMTLANAHAALG
jgi:hypothetical protein